MILVNLQSGCTISFSSDPFESCVFEDEGFASDGFELDDDSCVLAWCGFHDGAFSELGVGDDASDGVLAAT